MDARQCAALDASFGGGGVSNRLKRLSDYFSANAKFYVMH